MKRCRLLLALLPALALWLTPAAHAASRVYELRYAIPDEVAAAVQAVHGAEVRTEVVRQRLLVVGPEHRLRAIDTLLAELDQAPLPLHLTLTLQQPAAPGGRTFSAGASEAVELATVEGAFVTLERSRFGQQAGSAGWLIEIDEVPVAIEAVTLQLRRHGDDRVDVVVSYTHYENGQRRVLGNTVPARLGEWVSLLPTTAQAQPVAGNHYATAPLRADQLWLRIAPGR